MKLEGGCGALAVDEFGKDLAQLNPEQLRSVNWGGQPALVLAGPGSGKTRVITCRLARLIRESPDARFKVMGLTFTNKAAGEMKNRIARYIPDDLDRVFVDTFHSFAALVIRTHGSSVGIRPDFAICSPSQAYEVYSEALKSLGVGSLRPRQAWAELAEISKLKSRLVPPENTSQVLGPGPVAARIGTRYAAYERALAMSNRLDFDSLILRAYQLLQSSQPIADHYRTAFPIISVDEFQDTDYAQYALLGYLGSRQPRSIFAVADEDQLIYSWRGASTTRLRQFGIDYGPTVIGLPTNYRCPNELIALADRLIRANPNRPQDRVTQGSPRPPSAVTPFRVIGPLADDEEEAVFIATDIGRRAIPDCSTVAVLASRWTVIETIADALSSAGVRVATLARREEFGSSPFNWLADALVSALDPTNRDKFGAFLKSTSRLTGALARPSKRRAPSAAGLMTDWARSAAAGDSTSLLGKVATLIAADPITDASLLRFCDGALALFETQEFQAALSQRPELSDYRDDRKVWAAIVREILEIHGREVDLATFAQELQLRSKEPIPDPGTVLLLTIHGAKGREFNHVYLAGLAEGILPYVGRGEGSEEAERLDEARRSCYVAITRAKDTLTLTSARSYDGRAAVPSRFLKEMGLPSSGGPGL